MDAPGRAWEVVYFQTVREECPIEEFLDSLSVKARAKCLAYIDALEQHGNNLPANYIAKVEKDLWELRPEFGGVEHRFFYFTFVNRQIVIVHAVKKKRQRLKGSDVATAQARVAEVRERERLREEQRGNEKEPEITSAIRIRTDRQGS